MVLPLKKIILILKVIGKVKSEGNIFRFFRFQGQQRQLLLYNQGHVCSHDKRHV